MPVIVMTGFIDEFTYDKAIESGAADFIKKPFTAAELPDADQNTSCSRRSCA